MIKTCGWPGKLDKGRAAHSASLIIQHGELDYQLKYLPIIKAANARHELRKEAYPYLIDRILVRQGKLQEYGTESDFGNGKLAPVADPNNLNKRRKTAGLKPLPGFD